MTKLSFKFQGTVGQLMHLLNGVHSDTIVRASTVSTAKPKLEESLEDRTWRECVPLVKAGNRVGAIKLWRERTTAGLKDAKDAIEARGVAAGLYKMGKQGYLTSDRNEWI